MAQVELIFDCPYCHEPFSDVVGEEVDIHSGASYSCRHCSNMVVFQVFATEEYVAYCEWFRQQHTAEANHAA